MEHRFTITDADASTRLDVFLTAQLADFSRSKIQKIIKDNQVTVNGKTVTPHYALEVGDDVVAMMPDSATEAITLTPRPDIALDIVYEDDAVMVINKPSGLLVHPAVPSDDATLVHALLAHCPKIASVGDESAVRPGIVHRLDKDASGLLVVAKTPAAFEHLKAQFKNHSVQKTYAVLVDGQPPEESATISLMIGRKKGDGKMAARAEAKEGDREAITHYSVDEHFTKTTLLTVRTETGRTHQIRAHMHAIGCSVVGDNLYGTDRGARAASPRLFLHAKSLAFDHPVTGERKEFTSPLPPELQEILSSLTR